MNKDKCPNCGENFWVSGPRWGDEICHECGMDKPKPDDDE